MLDFSGKVVFVTGGGGGIGKGIALRFAQAGADVIVHYHSNEGGAQTVVQEIKDMGRQAAAFSGNLAFPDDAGAIIQSIDKLFSRLDVLINNSGIYPLATVLDMTPEQWDQVIDTNLKSAHLCTQAAARVMIERKIKGAVINITSIEAMNPAPNHSHYTASKGGLLMYTRSSAFELGEHGIRVNAVAPGLIWSEGLDTNWPDGVKRYLKNAPLGRLGYPEDVADACLFLASPAARWISGANLVVDGGVMTHQIF